VEGGGYLGRLVECVAALIGFVEALLELAFRDNAISLELGRELIVQIVVKVLLFRRSLCINVAV
jgi:hypothetical protein